MVLRPAWSVALSLDWAVEDHCELVAALAQRPMLLEAQMTAEQEQVLPVGLMACKLMVVG